MSTTKTIFQNVFVVIPKMYSFDERFVCRNKINFVVFKIHTNRDKSDLWIILSCNLCWKACKFDLKKPMINWQWSILDSTEIWISWNLNKKYSIFSNAWGISKLCYFVKLLRYSLSPNCNTNDFFNFFYYNIFVSLKNIAKKTEIINCRFNLKDEFLRITLKDFGSCSNCPCGFQYKFVSSNFVFSFFQKI
jgi:hypothetical protein